MLPRYIAVFASDEPDAADESKTFHTVPLAATRRFDALKEARRIAAPVGYHYLGCRGSDNNPDGQDWVY